MVPNYKAENREELKKLLHKRPGATHAYFRRPDGVLVDVPIMQATFTINNKPMWRVDDVAGGDVVDFPADAAADEEIEVPPKPSEEERTAAEEPEPKPEKPSVKKGASKRASRT